MSNFLFYSKIKICFQNINSQQLKMHEERWLRLCCFSPQTLREIKQSQKSESSVAELSSLTETPSSLRLLSGSSRLF